MIGAKKLSTIREELQEALADEKCNPIAALDGEIHKLKKSKTAIGAYFNLLPAMPGGREQVQKLRDSLKMDASQFHERWAAD